MVYKTPAATDGLIIEQESSTDIRQANLACRQTVTGALAALKVEVGNNQVLKECLWAACNSPIIEILELSKFADLCRVIYNPITTKKVALKFPRYWGVKHLGKCRLHFFCTSKIRTSLNPPKDSSTSSTKHKREDHRGPSASGPQITFKQSKLAAPPSTPSSTTAAVPSHHLPKPKLHIPNFLSSNMTHPPVPSGTTTPATPATPGGGLKLKLKIGPQPKH
ncbi:hypothetical protein BJX63DRAFT_431405 [Aspergillus granulosus]|uniref:Uncharacterized protein n=1 Tax=Aspergillus granulosus TaxID=176169 RepID=A0ABR4HG90_9EURO